MRVMHVIDSLGRGGGAERALRVQLLPLGQRGIQAHVVCLRDSTKGKLADEIRREGIPVTTLEPASLIGQVRQLRHLVRRERPDLVHVTLFQSSLVARLALLGVRTPLLNSLVNTAYAPERLRGLAHARWKQTLVRWVDRLTATRVDHFHVLSNAVADSAARGLGVELRRTTLIPRGRDAASLGERSLARRSRVRASLGETDEAFIVLTAGRQELSKDQATLIRAISTMPETSVVLLIAGMEGSATQHLQQEIADLGVGGRVRVLGHREDVPDLMAASDLFAFPSLHEGLGSAVIEAMALGLPVVASDIPAVRDLLGGGSCGVLVPPGDSAAFGDAIRRLMSSPHQREELGRRAVDRFRHHYELGAVVDKTAALYREMVQR